MADSQNEEKSQIKNGKALEVSLDNKYEAYEIFNPMANRPGIYRALFDVSCKFFRSASTAVRRLVCPASHQERWCGQVWRDYESTQEEGFR